MASYDFPLNERIRTLLRVESMLEKVVQYTLNNDHHCALLALLQVLDIVDRADFRADLLQELERQKILMQTLKGNPAIASKKLDALLNDINETVTALRASGLKLGQVLRENEWLKSIKQRANISGGLCEFDLPSYHFWLNATAERRQKDLQSWLEPFLPMQQAVRIILHILRGSGSTIPSVANMGIYQQVTDSNKPTQLLKIDLADTLNCFPEVSANKYAIHIRFNQLDDAQKLQKYTEDVHFSLALCHL